VPDAGRTATRHLLLLAGSGEARALAGALAARPGWRVTASLAGAVRAPLPQGVPTRTGGFGGDTGFAQWLADHRVAAVVDATHPFAARISARTARICAAAGVPSVQLLRPGWTEAPGDRWTRIDAPEAAADLIAPGAVVFLATGREGLERFASLAPRRVWCRVIDAPGGPFPFAGGAFLTGRPPFAVDAEIATFRDLGVDWLVTKESGGDASRTKLDAARALGLPVALLRRPAPAGGTVVASADGALAWVDAL
jgi:precorrin-6A/cobalt-precorrin-6A reductase